MVDRVSVAFAALLAAACIADANAAPEASDPAAVKLMAQCKAASGGAALDRPAAFHETGTILRDGKAGTYEMYGDLHAIRTSGIHTIDGKIGGGGYDGTKAWHFGPDGKVVVVTDPAQNAQEMSSAYFTISAYFFPDRFPATFKYRGRKNVGRHAYDVVAITPEGGVASDLWLDTRTHRVMRFTIEGVDAAGDILSYRAVEGTWIGFKNRQIEGQHSMVQTLASYDYVPLDPGRFLPPHFGQ